MGLISAALSSASSVLADQWEEYFYCDSMPSDVLVVRASKKTSRKGFNKKGNDNIISNGSVIAVNEGQCMMIVDNGKVMEFSAEPGEFVYDSSTEPSIFCGDLGDNIKKTFAQFAKRVAFGGEAPKDQRVYYFNTKEIMGNKYGTASPVPYRVVDRNANLDIDISIRCHGEYSYRIIDPICFYANVCGNVASTYNRSNLDSMLKTELMTALQEAFAKISEQGIRYSALPGHATEIADALNEVLSDKWTKRRGLAVVSFGVSSVKAPEEDEQMIKEMQRTAALKNGAMAGATIAQATADAMKMAASNSGGAMMGFAGLNMATQMGNANGVNMANLYAMGQQQEQAAQAAQAAPQMQPASATWTCSCGASGNTGKFCMECGQPKPAENGWTCSCGAINKGKFCQECGKPKPAGAKLYKCDKCGWEPEDPANPPKFCPQCGDRFDDSDVIG